MRDAALAAARWCRDRWLLQCQSGGYAEYTKTSTALGAFYRRVAVRICKAKAITATARKLALLLYRVLTPQPSFSRDSSGQSDFSDRSDRRCRHGLGLLSIGATTTGGFNALSSNWAIYEETAREQGKTVDRKFWRLVGPVHVAETRENVRYGLQKWLFYFREVAALALAPFDAPDPVEALISSGMAVIGTLEDCIAQIERLRKTVWLLRLLPAARTHLAKLGSDTAFLRDDRALRDAAFSERKWQSRGITRICANEFQFARSRAHRDERRRKRLAWPCRSTRG